MKIMHMRVVSVAENWNLEYLVPLCMLRQDALRLSPSFS